MTCSPRQRFVLGWCRISSATAVLAAGLLLWRLVSPVGGEQGPAAPKLDPAFLSEIAQDVLSRALAGPDQPLPEATSRIGEPEAITVVGSAPNPAPALTHIPPAREGISVFTPPTLSSPKQVLPTPAATSYQSNSWRQAPPETVRSLSFSSGVLPPALGLDPS